MIRLLFENAALRPDLIQRASYHGLGSLTDAERVVIIEDDGDYVDHLVWIDLRIMIDAICQYG